MRIPRPSGILAIGADHTLFPPGSISVPAQETELDPMTKYIIKLDDDDKDDELPGWMYQEVRDHDRRYNCEGHVYVDGPWGGLVCKKCGR